MRQSGTPGKTWSVWIIHNSPIANQPVQDKNFQRTFERDRYSRVQQTESLCITWSRYFNSIVGRDLITGTPLTPAGLKNLFGWYVTGPQSKSTPNDFAKFKF